MPEKRERKLKEDMLDLLVEAGTISFDLKKHAPEDEKLPPDAKFRVNFEALLRDYRAKLADIMLRKIKECIYDKHEVQCIIGFGNSGSTISQYMKDAITENPDFEELRKKKDQYRFTRWNRDKKFYDDPLQPGDKALIVDEGLISGASILSYMYEALVQFYGKQIVDTDAKKVSDIKLSFPVVLVGLDMLLVDEQEGRCKAKLLGEEIGKKYNPDGAPAKVLSVVTLKDYAERVAGDEQTALAEYLTAQEKKKKPVEVTKVA